MEKTQNRVFDRKNIAKTIKIFSICLLITAASVFGAQINEEVFAAQKPVKEASLFNGNESNESQSNAVSNSLSKTTYVIPLGTAFGIKLFTDGVIVASLTDIPNGESHCCPAQDAGIQPGDYVISVNGMDVENNTALASVIGSSEGQPLDFKLRRENETFETTVTPVFSNGSFRAGMWVRDSAAGIGTLTFYNPDTGIFAGLGHGICDTDTSELMSLNHGEPAEITLCGIIPGTKDKPGQLQGYFTTDEALGSLVANNETGVYGRLDEDPQGELMEVMPKNEVTIGNVQILTSLDNTGPKLYNAQITKINPQDQDTQNMIITITDERLLSETGGIVQGMSGCPIIQDGKLAGAITHVFVDDPTTGYGIFSESMVMESVVFSMSD